MRANDDGFLAQQLFQLAAILPPPFLVDFICHNFEDDDVVALGFIALRDPKTFGRCTGKSGQSAEARYQLVANPAVDLVGKFVAFIVIDGQQYLYEMHRLSIPSGFA